MIERQEVLPEAAGVAGLVLRKLRAHQGFAKKTWDYDNKVSHIGTAKRANDIVKLRVFLDYLDFGFSEVSTAVEALRASGSVDIAADMHPDRVTAVKELRDTYHATGMRAIVFPLSTDTLSLVALYPEDVEIFIEITTTRGISNHRKVRAMYEEMKSSGAPSLVSGYL